MANPGRRKSGGERQAPAFAPPDRSRYAVSTQRWHTVSATRYSTMNAAIATEGSSPKFFEMQQGTDEISGCFEPWELVPGGYGKTIRMRLPIECCLARIAPPGSTAAAEPQDLGAFDLYIEVEAAFQVELVFVAIGGDRWAVDERHHEVG